MRQQMRRPIPSYGEKTDSSDDPNDSRSKSEHSENPSTHSEDDRLPDEECDCSDDEADDDGETRAGDCCKHNAVRIPMPEILSQ